MSCCSSKSETPPRPPSSAIDNGICSSRFCGRDLRFSLSALHGLEGVELRFVAACGAGSRGRGSTPGFRGCCIKYRCTLLCGGGEDGRRPFRVLEQEGEGEDHHQGGGRALSLPRFLWSERRAVRSGLKK